MWASYSLLDDISATAFETLNKALVDAGLPACVPSARRKALFLEKEQEMQAKMAEWEKLATQATSGGDATASSQPTSAVAAGKKPQLQQSSPAETASTAIPSQISERMLDFGRTRNWSEALQLLHSVDIISRHRSQSSSSSSSSSVAPPPIPPPLVSAVTLLYNCAISAAVDRVDIVDDIAAEMKRLGLQHNATTNNTIMTALGKTEDRWHEALELFQSATSSAAPAQQRDGSTYSVALSVLGKRGQWEKAVQVFQDMKKQPGLTKPSGVAYGLLVQSAHKDNWVLTLKAFQEMVKVHGPASAKEVVVNRVVKSLDAAGKTAEATRLLESVRKKK